MFRTIAQSTVFAAVFAIISSAVAQPQTPATLSPIGRWLTQDHDGVIEIAACGATLCGRIVGMRKPLGADGTPAHDPAGHPSCGLTILDQVTQPAPGDYRAQITDPNDGKVWNCVFSLAADGTLRLRGYVLVRALGRTQTWTRYQGPIGTGCSLV